MMIEHTLACESSYFLVLRHVYLRVATRFGLLIIAARAHGEPHHAFSLMIPILNLRNRESSLPLLNASVGTFHP